MALLQRGDVEDEDRLTSSLLVGSLWRPDPKVLFKGQHTHDRDPSRNLV
jgi:hypothetical protein